MEENKDIIIEQSKNKNIIQTETVGFILKQKRRELKFSLEDVSSHLKIKKFYLDAIENNEFSNLPGIAYVIGFIKSYAYFLGLDQKKLIELYKYMNNTQVDNEVDKKDENVAIKDPIVNTNHLILVLLVILFILIVVAVIKFIQTDTDNVKPAENIELSLNNEKKEDITDLTSTERVELLLDSGKKINLTGVKKIDENNIKVPDYIKTELEINQTQDNAGNKLKEIQKEKEAKEQDLSQLFREFGLKDKNTSKIILKITKDNWIKIKKDGLYKYDEKLGDIGDGVTIFEGVLKSGDIYYIPDEPGYYLTIGNAQGVDIVVDGKVIEPLSKNEVSRHNIEMNVEKLLNGTAYKRN